MPWFVATVFILTGGAPVFAEEYLVKDGQGRAEIIIGEKPARMAKLAATELQENLQKISGAKLPIKTVPTDGCPVQIYVGRSDHTDRLKITEGGLRHGAFRMVSGKNWLVLLGRDRDFTPREPHMIHNGHQAAATAAWDKLTGAKWGFPHTQLYKHYHHEMKIWEQDERGSLNAVHEFLRMQGMRWYMPGELGETFQKKATIDLPRIDKTVRPDFPVRYPVQYFHLFAHELSRDECLWQLRLGLNEAPDMIGVAPLAHGIEEVHSRDEVKRAHPEYFALWGGKRALDHFGAGAPCLSSEGLFKDNVAYVRKFFDIYDAPMVSVMPADGYGTLCQCPLCEGKGTSERGSEGSLSDYVWGYVIRVAEEVHKTHPDKKILCLAYGTYSLPPKNLKKLPPNVLIGLAQGRCYFSLPERQKNTDELRKRWLEKLPDQQGRFIIYDYYLQNRPGHPHEGTPAFFPHTIASDLRSLKGISIGDFIEVYRAQKDSPPLTLATNHLNLYVTSRLWWDANQDVDALLDDYYANFYGPARSEMKAFMDFAEKHWVGMTKSVADIDQSILLLEAARKAAGDTKYGKRIDLIAGYLRPLKQLRQRLATGRKNVPEARTQTPSTALATLDGRLDKPFWDVCPNYHLWNLQTGKYPAQRTTFKVARANKSIYFGIRCEESDIANLSIGSKKNDDPGIWSGDSVELLLETQAHSYYQLAISPTGALVSADRKEKIDTRWKSAAKVATHIGDKFWSAEIEVPIAGDLQVEVDPLNGVAGRIPSETHPWFFNVCRQRVRNKEIEHSAFSTTGTDNFHDILKFAKLR